MPVTPARLVYATNWTGGSGNFGPGETRTYQATGKAGIPNSNVSAVVVNVSARSTSATTSSFLTLWAAGVSRPVVSSLYYTQDNVPRSNTAIVPVSSTGAINLYNYTGSTAITVDVQGYFTRTSTADSTGGYVALLEPTRIANTATGQYVAAAKVQPGSYVDVQATGRGGIGTDATAVFANIEVANPTANGELLVGPGGVTPSGSPALNYGDSGRYDSGLSIRLNSTGALRVYNRSGSAIDIKVDVQGYFSGDPSMGGAFAPLSPANVYSTTETGQIALQGKETRAVRIAGRGGLPAAGSFGAAALTLSVKNWTSGGTVAVFSNDVKWPGISNVGFDRDEGEPTNGISSTVISQVSSRGYVALYNTSTEPITLTLTAQGWFTNGSAANRPENNQVVLAGTVDTTVSAATSKWSAAIEPNEATLSSMAVGGTATGLLLPTTAVRVSGNSYSVVVDPEAVPSNYLDNGMATITLAFLDEASNKIGSITRTVEVLSAADRLRVAPELARRTWVDPELNDPGEGSTEVAAGPDSADGEAVAVAPTGPSPSTAGADLADDETIDHEIDSGNVGTLIADAPAAAVVRSFNRSIYDDYSKGAAVFHLLALSDRWVTVGTTYSVGNNPATMTYRGGRSTTMGITMSYNGGASWLKGGGEKTLSSSWKFTYLPKAWAGRLYQIAQRWGKYRVTNQITGFSSLRWMPITDTGWTRYLSITNIPNWSFCGRVAQGEWSRSDGVENGRGYSFGSAVKIKGLIGFDLSSRHAWTTNTDLVYNIRESGRNMCGSNDVPVRASKVQMKW